MRPIDGDAIEKDWYTELHSNYKDEYAKGFRAGLMAAVSYPTIDAYGTWIPCSERLPKVEGSYMTTTEYGAVRVNHFYTRNNTWGYKSNRTIAWMPLPEPYREEKKDE